jgi:hypothetical protein
MFITLRSYNNYIYNDNPYMYYAFLPFYFFFCLVTSLVLTIINLPGAVYYITSDKYYNNIYTKIYDLLVNIIVGFCFLYSAYFTELMNIF